MDMLSRKSFQFSLRPTKKQMRALDAQLNECRWLYNELLAQSKLAYEQTGGFLTKLQQQNRLPLMKKERPSLSAVHSQVLQNVNDRLDKAFQGFFRRCKAGGKPGFPRFRGVHRYNSLCYPQSGFSIVNGELKLSKIGSIRIKTHRPIAGEIKTCTLRKNASGDWIVSLSCMVDAKELPTIDESVGIDVGLTHFAVLSNGEKIANPRFFQKGEKKLAKAQKKLSELKKGSKERGKQGKVVAKTHAKISAQRKDFCHKESKKIIDRYQFICIEDLDVKRMIEGSPLAKKIVDASWSQFRQFLTYKAEDAGRKLGLANPAYTTQTCNQCGNRKQKALREREHCCTECGYCTDRDHNAAQNILALGIDGLGATPRSLRL